MSLDNVPPAYFHTLSDAELVAIVDAARAVIFAESDARHAELEALRAAGDARGFELSAPSEASRQAGARLHYARIEMGERVAAEYRAA